MSMPFQEKSLAIACSLAFACAGSAHADQLSDLQSKLDAMQKQIQELQAQIGSVKKAQERQEAAPAPGITMKPGNDLIFQVGGGEIQIYGHVDVSLDDQTTGMSGFMHDGQTVTGRNGYVPDVSSNLSFFGVRGARSVGDDLTALFQFETEVAFAATPGAIRTAPPLLGEHTDEILAEARYRPEEIAELRAAGTI